MVDRATVLAVGVTMLLAPATALAGDGHRELEAGPLEIANAEHHETHVAVAVDGEPEEKGAWGPVLEGQIPAVNLALLPGGRLLYYDGFEVNQAKDDHAHVHFAWNASPLAAQTRVARITGEEIDVRTPNPESGGGFDLFCSGTTISPEGLAVAPGGNRYFTFDEGYPNATYGPIKGANQTLVFPPTPLDEIGSGDADWHTGPNMSGPRWYPSGLQLPDGDTLVASGTRTLGYPHARNTLIETFDPDKPGDGWQRLGTSFEVAPGASVPQQVLPEDPEAGLALVDDAHRGPPNVPSYPRLNVVPAGPHAGEVLYSSTGYILGPHPSEPLWGHFQTLDPDAGEWSVHTRSTTGVRNLGASVPLMLDASDPQPRYLAFGGSIEETIAGGATAEIVDASKQVVTSTPTDPLHFPRWSVNGVLLPDGSVLAVGGSFQDEVIVYGSPAQAPMNPELFVPDENGTGGHWELLPPMETVRAYHSTAILLPDGRVALGGHVPPPPVHEAFRENGNPQVNRSTFEIYEPPYLHHADDETRPAIREDSFEATTSLPGATALEADFGDEVSFEVTGADHGVEDVVLRRPGATTHQYNADQLGIRLDADTTPPDSEGSLEVTVQIPEELEIAPGYYMLFVNEDGPEGVYPSKAAWVALGEETSLEATLGS